MNIMEITNCIEILVNNIKIYTVDQYITNDSISVCLTIYLFYLFVLLFYLLFILQIQLSVSA